MAKYAIGDLQGCYDELRQLLDVIEFDPEKDKLWFVGDLVNRGPNSLETLRFVKGLGDRAVTVLGNHDMHLLAVSQGNARQYRNGSLEDVLTAPDRDELIHWLRHQRMMHHDPNSGFSMVHAGLPPQWDLSKALACAREVEVALQGGQFAEFCAEMYGDTPDIWREDLAGMERLRFITNCFTRLRFCDKKGYLKLKEKGRPKTTPRSRIVPWYEVPNRATKDNKIIFGHWSTLGYYQTQKVWAIDSGCLWGGKLTAIKLRKSRPPKVIQLPCPGVMKPGED